MFAVVERHSTPAPTVMGAHRGVAADGSVGKLLIWSASLRLVWRISDERGAGLTRGLDVWALPPETAAGPGRDGRSLRGRAHRQGVDRRGQADVGPVQSGPRLSRADEARSAHRGSFAGAARGADPRLRRDRRKNVHGDAPRRG